MDINVSAACEAIQSKLTAGFTPKVGLVLGSGLGDVIHEMKVNATIDYGDIPGFHRSSVQGHAGKLVFGHLFGAPVVCMSGRFHLYEGVPVQQIALPMRVMKQLGCHTVILTNAAGSLNPEIGPGSVSIIEDQINLSGHNVLVGPNDDTVGPRFLPMENVYDAALRHKFINCGKKAGLDLHVGTYLGVLGPSYETPAEIRAFRLLGADLVGMSTVNEAIAAHHCGLKVVGLSAVSNLAAGLSDQNVSHEEVLVFGKAASQKLKNIIQLALPGIA